MKKIYLLLLATFLNLGLFSCTPQALEEHQPVADECCGEGGEIPPPPPPLGG